MKFKDLKPGELFTEGGDIFIKSDSVNLDLEGNLNGTAWSLRSIVRGKTEPTYYKFKEWAFRSDDEVQKLKQTLTVDNSILQHPS